MPPNCWSGCAPRTCDMARNRAQQLCIVTLDYQRFLLPQADALKLIDIMSRAAEVQADYASGAGF